MRLLHTSCLALAAMMVIATTPLSQAEPPPTVTYGGMLARKPPKPQMPDIQAPPAAWPRLDTGAVVCRTEGDLQRHAAAMRGEAAGPADCRLINQATAISILSRHGPGQTEVKFTGSDETGWTDAWLPAHPPPGSAAASNR